MPTVRFKMRDLQGSPIANTWFRAEPGYQDSVVSGGDLPRAVEFYTDGNGQATAELVAGRYPYYLTKQHAGAPDQVAYKLFVPASTAVLEANVLYVDLGMHMRFTNDASLLTLIDTKVSVLAALDQIKLISSVILPGSDKLQEILDGVAEIEAALEAFRTQFTAKLDAAVAKSDQAIARANQAIAAVAQANANAMTAARLSEQAHEVAVLADQHAQEGKLLGQNALAAINLLAARVTALGG